MLVVKVEINGKVIEALKCVRTQKLLSETSSHKYEMYDGQGRSMGALWHKYSDGASMLAKLMVMRWQDEQSKHEDKNKC